MEIRAARPTDAPAIVALIRVLSEAEGDSSPLTEAYVHTYLTSSSGQILLAIEGGHPVGLLSYSVRPDLYHAGDTALIEELVVEGTRTGGGVGSALMRALFERLKGQGCIEVSVTTMPDNAGAIRFYKAHGMNDEAVFLEKHFESI